MSPSLSGIIIMNNYHAEEKERAITGVAPLYLYCIRTALTDSEKALHDYLSLFVVLRLYLKIP
jgi:hypothetical protein